QALLPGLWRTKRGNPRRARSSLVPSVSAVRARQLRGRRRRRRPAPRNSSRPSGPRHPHSADDLGHPVQVQRGCRSARVRVRALFSGRLRARIRRFPGAAEAGAMTRGLSREALRFLVAGAFNTAVTYALSLGLLRLVDYTQAYTIAYAVGIAFAYFVGTGFVFRVRRSVRGALSFPVVYLAQYLLGVLVLRLAVDTLGVAKPFALLIVIATTLPVTFVLSRWLLHAASGGPVAAGQDRIRWHECILAVALWAIASFYALVN